MYCRRKVWLIPPKLSRHPTSLPREAPYKMVKRASWLLVEGLTVTVGSLLEGLPCRLAPYFHFPNMICRREHIRGEYSIYSDILRGPKQKCKRKGPQTTNRIIYKNAHKQVLQGHMDLCIYSWHTIGSR